MSEMNEPVIAFEAWMAEEFAVPGFRIPETWPCTTFRPGTPWGDVAAAAKAEAERASGGALPRMPATVDTSTEWGQRYAVGIDAAGKMFGGDHLVGLIEKERIPGDVIEFGVFGGTWLLVLLKALEARGANRQVWGLDSFEGLPEPSKYDPPNTWTKGQYAASLESVRAALDADKRPNLHLVEGWFKDTLPTRQMQDVRQIAYARIDCDLYEPTLECLDWLGPRMTDGSILVFDDWQYNLDLGETKAFREWRQDNKHLKFELLGMNLWANLFLRVRRR